MFGIFCHSGSCRESYDLDLATPILPSTMRNEGFLNSINFGEAVATIHDALGLMPHRTESKFISDSSMGSRKLFHHHKLCRKM